MANIKSSKKNIRSILKRRNSNRSIKNKVKTLKRNLEYSLKNNDSEVYIHIKMKNYFSYLDKAANKLIIHPNKVNAQKSFFTKKINLLKLL